MIRSFEECDNVINGIVLWCCIWLKKGKEVSSNKKFYVFMKIIFDIRGYRIEVRGFLFTIVN